MLQRLAYYLLGYVVGCALKACIAKKIRRYDFPDKKLANDSFTHNLGNLITTAGLRTELVNEIRINMDFAKNWSIVRDWSEQSRYECNISETKAKDFYTVSKNGVLSWLK